MGTLAEYVDRIAALGTAELLAELAANTSLPAAMQVELGKRAELFAELPEETEPAMGAPGGPICSLSLLLPDGSYIDATDLAAPGVVVGIMGDHFGPGSDPPQLYAVDADDPEGDLIRVQDLAGAAVEIVDFKDSEETIEAFAMRVAGRFGHPPASDEGSVSPAPPVIDKN